MNASLNIGRSLALPYESQYAMWRRLLLANQSLKITDILKHLSIKETGSIERNLNIARSCFSRTVELNYSTSNPLPAYLNLFTENNIGSALFAAERNCPICAKLGYHCDLYRLPWLKTCPIHHQPITEKCPECGKSWPTWYESKKRKCRVCGTAPVDLHLEFRQLEPAIDFGSIHELFQLIQSANDNNGFLLSTHWPILEPRYSVNFFDENFPQYISQYLNKNIKNIVRKLDIKVTKPNTWEACQIIPTQEHKTSFSRHFKTSISVRSSAECIRKIKMEALGDLWKTISQTTGEPHELTLYNLTAIKDADLTGDIIPCDYCLAFSIWHHLVGSLPHSGYNQLVLRSSIYNHLDLSKLIIPKPMDSIIADNRIFQLSEEVTFNLYYRDLVSCFSNLLIYVSEAIQHLRSGKTTNFTPSFSGQSSQQLEREVYFSVKKNKSYAIDDQYICEIFYGRPKKESLETLKNTNCNHIDCTKFKSYLNHKNLEPLVNKSSSHLGIDVETIFKFQFGHNYQYHHNNDALPIINE